VRRLLALALLLAAPAPAAAELPRLDVDRTGGRPTIATTDGREVLLRGVNVNQLGDYFQFDPQQPTVFELTEADFEGIARAGFDTVRLVTNWSAWQPERGSFDQAYLARVREAVRLAERHGLYTVIDMHQDAWGKAIATKPGEACPPGFGPAVGWDGAPAWATITDGQTTCRVQDTRELSPAVAQAFTNFYLDRDGIQTQLVETWGRIARAFARDTAVAGFDLLNEPHPGYAAVGGQTAPLGRFYARAIDAIRAGEREGGGFPHLVVFEPSVVWSGAGADAPVPPGFSADRRLVFSPHLYNESITLDTRAGARAATIEEGWDAARETAALYDAPLWSGEWGWFGEPSADVGKVRRFVAEEDASMHGSAWWVWRQTCGDPHVAGAPTFSGSLNRYACPGSRPLGLNTTFTTLLGRARPRFAPGRLTQVRSDGERGTFDVRGLAREGDACGLELWVPGERRPFLRAEGVAGLAARKVPGGWWVTGCARGSWRVDGQAEAGTEPRACTSRRVITATLRGRGALRSVRVRIGDGRAVRAPARRRVRIDLRGRPAGTVVVRIEAVTRAGRRLSEQRTYRTCVTRR
jgi:endoglycosylceramidase